MRTHSHLECLFCGCPCPTPPPRGWTCPNCGDGFVRFVYSALDEDTP